MRVESCHDTMNAHTVTAVVQFGVGLAVWTKFVKDEDPSALAILDAAFIQATTATLGFRMICALLELWLAGRKINAPRLRKVKDFAAGLNWFMRLIYNSIYLYAGATSQTLRETFQSGVAYVGLISFVQVLQQAPLYQAFPSHTKWILATALTDATLTCYVARRHIDTTILKQLPVELFTTVLLPYSVHKTLPGLVVGQAAKPAKKAVYESVSPLKEQASKACISEANTSQELSLASDIYKNAGANKYADKHGEFTKGLQTKSAQLNKLSRNPAYESRLVKQRRQVAVKLRTDMQLSQLPPDLTVQIQSALEDICGSSYSIANLAIREGCILLSADIVQAVHDTQTQEVSYNSAGVTNSASISTALAQALLPVLSPLLQRKDLSRMQSGEYVRVQVGDTVVRCHWDVTHQTWSMKQEEISHSSRSFFSRPQLGLVRLSQGMIEPATPLNEEDVRSQPVTCSHGCTPESIKSPKVVETSYGSIQVDLQLHGLSNNIDVEALNSSITGWSAPCGKHSQPSIEWGAARIASASHDDMAADQTKYQVLAHCNGTYFNTQVQAITYADKESGNAVMRVLIHASDAVQHHPGQVLPCVQLLTMELWSMELLLSSSTAVLPPPPIVKPDNCSIVSQRQPTPCWWWGSSPAAVTAGVFEYQQLLDSLWQSDVDTYSTSAYKTFAHDLSLWLMAVRGAAVTSRRCVSCPATSSVAACAPLLLQSMNKQKLEELGQDLMTYAKESQMQDLACMIRQQLVYVKRCSFSAPTPQPRGLTANVVKLARAVRVSGAGLPCMQCEQFYRQQLSKLLSSTYSLRALVLIICRVPFMLHALTKHPSASYLIMALLWVTPLLGTLVACLLKGNKASRLCSTAPACCLVITAMWWLFLATTGDTQPPIASRAPSLYIVVTINTMVSLGEQVPSSAALPAPCVTAASLCIAIGQAITGWRAGPRCLASPINFLAIIGARLVADMQLRSAITSMPALHL